MVRPVQMTAIAAEGFKIDCAPKSPCFSEFHNTSEQGKVGNAHESLSITLDRVHNV